MPYFNLLRVSFGDFHIQKRCEGCLKNYAVFLMISIFFCNAAKTVSNSFFVVFFPNEKRIVPNANSCGTPIALRTRLTTTEFAVQALPAETYIPSAESVLTKTSASTPANEMFTLLGSRWTGWPFNLLWGTSFNIRSMK